MSFLEDFANRKEIEFNAHVRPEIRKMVEAGRKLTTDEYEKLRLNSYEAVLIYPLLDDVAFVRLIRHCLSNSGVNQSGRWTVETTYDEVLLGRLVYQLCDRLEQRMNELMVGVKKA